MLAVHPRTVLALSVFARLGARAAASGEAALEEAVTLRPGPAAKAGEQTIFFVRHAEGWHNKHSRELANWKTDALGLRPEYRDAKLTPVGEEQARSLNAELRGDAAFAPPEVVVVSTLSRTIQTATLAFEGLDAGPFVATELCRERIADHECDHRAPRRDLERDWPSVDFSGVADDEDTLWTTRKEVEPEEMNATLCSDRARDFLAWLRARPEGRIAVVGHWVFLRHLFALYPGITDFADFKNAEMRVATIGGAAPRRAGEL